MMACHKTIRKSEDFFWASLLDPWVQVQLGWTAEQYRQSTVLTLLLHHYPTTDKLQAP